MRKVAIALNMLSPYWYTVFNELGNRGWDIKIFIGLENEPDRLYEKEEYIEYAFQVVKTKNWFFDLRWLGIKTQFLHLQYGLWKEFKEWKPEVIVSTELGFRTFLAFIYGKIFSIPVIPWVCATKHTERSNSFLREEFRKWLLHRVSCVFTNMTEATKYLIEKLEVTNATIVHTPYVVDVKNYQIKVSEERKTSGNLKQQLGLRGDIFLYIGQMIERKGIKNLIESLKEVPERYIEKFSFLFVGGSISTTDENSLRNLGIVFSDIPFVQPRDIIKYYAVANVFVFPTLEDEWGIVINEAAASQLPILGSIYSGAVADLVFDEINGFRFDPLNSQSTAKAIIQFLEAPEEERLKMGKESLRIIEKYDINFTLNNLDTALCNLYENFRNRK